ncbi:MAG: tryptophan synthase subunit alpha [Candidatus Dadabacteria bacterium]|nr:MAG: tryptophan synthase subunit alpha [Candidatus Dadabacteria bacterium]
MGRATADNPAEPVRARRQGCATGRSHVGGTVMNRQTPGRLEAAFSRREDEGRKVFVAYLTVGDPGIQESLELADALVRQGVDIIELGVPFSDPVADGPTIQAASERALDRGTSLDDVFAVAGALRARHPDVGIVLMGYANPFHHYGLAETARRSADAGVDGWIVPDVSWEESWRFREHLNANGVAWIPLIAPTTGPQRAAEMLADTRPPFAYYVSVTGVTGVRSGLPEGWDEPYRAIREAAGTPIVLGFGIGNRDSAAGAAAVADGVVVGSAIVSRAATEPADAVATFVRELRDVV